MTPGEEVGSFSCELVGWQEAADLSRILAYKIRDSGYCPDIVIAIGRGGYVPARVVCDYMLHENLTSIKIEHWGIAAEKKEKATVVFPLSIGISDLKVLIIDDVTDTGETLKAAVDYIDSLGPAEIRTGILHHKDCSFSEPDFYVKYVEKWRWIIYPWALHEELYGFSEKVLSGEYATPGEIRKKLLEEYGFDADTGMLRAALSDLAASGKATRSGVCFKSVDKLKKR